MGGSQAIKRWRRWSQQAILEAAVNPENTVQLVSNRATSSWEWEVGREMQFYLYVACFSLNPLVLGYLGDGEH